MSTPSSARSFTVLHFSWCTLQASHNAAKDFFRKWSSASAHGWATPQTFWHRNNWTLVWQTPSRSASHTRAIDLQRFLRLEHAQCNPLQPLRLCQLDDAILQVTHFALRSHPSLLWRSMSTRVYGSTLFWSVAPRIVTPHPWLLSVNQGKTTAKSKFEKFVTKTKRSSQRNR